MYIKGVLIGSRKIVISGLGVLAYERGLPLSLSFQKLSDDGYEPSLLHAVDEMLKGGISKESIAKRLKEDFGEQKFYNYDAELISRFLFADYETQRAMIFEYLFKGLSHNEIVSIFTIRN